MRILYECDQQACEKCDPTGECTHTSDIYHAKNFDILTERCSNGELRDVGAVEKKFPDILRKKMIIGGDKNGTEERKFKMTFIEFAENVLGIGLLDWQKVVLEKAQECKDNGKCFYIHTGIREGGKSLLNNIYQQKLGYDRGYEQALKDLEKEES